MRLRSLLSVSAIALSAVVLAGCASGTAPATSESPSATEAAPSASADPAAADSLCETPLPGGASADAVTVTGEVGVAPEATFTAPLEITELQRTVVTEGTGDAPAPGDFVSYSLTAYDAATGDVLGTQGYTPGEILPAQVQAGSTLGQIVGCDPVGTRSVVTFPASGQTQAMIYVFDLTGITPAKAWGEDQAVVDGAPTITIDETGRPEVTVPDAEAPTETQITVTKLGDGAVVGTGDTVLLQYHGVKWSDGEIFDSSWDRGTPTSFATNQVIAGFTKALEGQTVGSQVIAVVPPADGYGQAEGNELQKETLIFVVDILGTSHAPAN